MPCKAHAWPLRDTRTAMDFLDKDLHSDVKPFPKVDTGLRWSRRIESNRKLEIRRYRIKVWNYPLAQGTPIIKKIREKEEEVKKVGMESEEEADVETEK
ncbi:hypothetical protein TWF696_003742 [Orbilia brochopaga]|uniref:Uncharacterized protein n=1 Tax=Orbilia brochopaga TaxID=3140254 RepID=A0AAV9V4W3_9PEZI